MLTPSIKGSFLAGVGLWLMFWALLFKADELTEAAHVKRWVNSAQCAEWISRHKSTALLCTEVVNYGTHGVSDPLSVAFALGGTLVNALVIYLILPCRQRILRRRTAITTSMARFRNKVI